MNELDKTEKPRFLTPAGLARRWNWHEESIRRLVRQRRIETVRIGRRILIPVEAIEMAESEGRIRRAA